MPGTHHSNCIHQAGAWVSRCAMCQALAWTWGKSGSYLGHGPWQNSSSGRLAGARHRVALTCWPGCPLPGAAQDFRGCSALRCWDLCTAGWVQLGLLDHLAGLGASPAMPLPPCAAACGLQPSRLLCPWDFLGKSTGVGCHRLLQTISAVEIIPDLSKLQKCNNDDSIRRGSGCPFLNST